MKEKITKENINIFLFIIYIIIIIPLIGIPIFVKKEFFSQDYLTICHCDYDHCISNDTCLVFTNNSLPLQTAYKTCVKDTLYTNDTWKFIFKRPKE
jgi:hypothetical protein